MSPLRLLLLFPIIFGFSSQGRVDELYTLVDQRYRRFHRGFESHVLNRWPTIPSQAKTPPSCFAFLSGGCRRPAPESSRNPGGHPSTPPANNGISASASSSSKDAGGATQPASKLRAQLGLGGDVLEIQVRIEMMWFPGCSYVLSSILVPEYTTFRPTDVVDDSQSPLLFCF